MGKLASFVLRGLFDTDGSITVFKNNGIVYPRIEIRLCPSPMQDQFIKIIEGLGFRCTIQNLKEGHIKLRISDRKELEKWFDLVGSSNLLYVKRAEPFLKTKV